MSLKTRLSKPDLVRPSPGLARNGLRRVSPAKAERPSSRRSEDDHEHADDDREQRDAFDERRRDDHLGLDLAGHLRLAGGRLDGAAADAADAEARANGGETRADRSETGGDGARLRERVRGVGGGSGGFSVGLTERGRGEESGCAAGGEREELADLAHF